MPSSASSLRRLPAQPAIASGRPFRERVRREVAMNEHRYTRIVIQAARPTTLYTEEETARYAHLEIQVIRRLQAVGLVEGILTVEGERRYSEEDVQRLRRIRRLRRDLGVNLAGAEVILELSRRLEELQRELEEYRRK